MRPLFHYTTSMNPYVDTPEFWQWVDCHIDDDPVKLRLKWQGKLPWANLAILQIECRRKSRKKLAEELTCPTLFFPTALSAEQCTSDILADFHASLIRPGDTLLDLTCGLGIDVYHAACRASEVTAVDMNPEITEAVIHNAAALGHDNITAVTADCREFIKNTDKHYDIVFIDPARRSTNGERIYRLADCSPDVTSMLGDIAAVSNRLIIKASPMLDITQVLRELPDTTDIYVTGTSTECKEIVADITFDNRHSSEPVIHVMTPLYDFSFTQSEEASATPDYDLPAAGEYLYEPGAAVMKAAPFRLLSQCYGLKKLHPNTHLYHSAARITDFPGDTWHIDRVADFSSHEIKAIARQHDRLNIATRNFDMSADTLRKKLKVKDGGTQRLIAATLADNSKAMLLLSPP